MYTSMSHISLTWIKGQTVSPRNAFLDHVVVAMTRRRRGDDDNYENGDDVFFCCHIYFRFSPVRCSGPDPDWIAFSSTEARWINFNTQMRVTRLQCVSLSHHCQKLGLTGYRFNFNLAVTTERKVESTLYKTQTREKLPWGALDHVGSTSVEKMAISAIIFSHIFPSIGGAPDGRCTFPEAVFGRSRSCRCDEDMVNAWIDDAMSVLFHWISKQPLEPQVRLQVWVWPLYSKSDAWFLSHKSGPAFSGFLRFVQHSFERAQWFAFGLFLLLTVQPPSSLI